MRIHGLNILYVHMRVHFFLLLIVKSLWLFLNFLYLEWLLFSTAQFLKSLLQRSQYWPQKIAHTSTIQVTETYKYFFEPETKKC